MDSFSSDREVLISFLERVPYSSYTSSKLLVRDDWPRYLLGLLNGAQLELCCIMDMIAYSRRGSDPLPIR